jgi:hypothetical protein
MNNFIKFSTDIIAANSSKRELTGVIVPFGQVGHTNMGDVVFTAGSLKIGEGIKLFTEHDMTRPIGKLSRYEEYFLKRSLELTKEGGIVAMVVPSGFLRGKIDYAKKEIAELGTIVDAYRLPNKSFETTDIGTDIVIFKKNTFNNHIKFILYYVASH